MARRATVRVTGVPGVTHQSKRSAIGSVAGSASALFFLAFSTIDSSADILRFLLGCAHDTRTSMVVTSVVQRAAVQAACTCRSHTERSGAYIRWISAAVCRRVRSAGACSRRQIKYRNRCLQGRPWNKCTCEQAELARLGCAQRPSLHQRGIACQQQRTSFRSGWALLECIESANESLSSGFARSSSRGGGPSTVAIESAPASLICVHVKGRLSSANTGTYVRTCLTVSCTCSEPGSENAHAARSACIGNESIGCLPAYRASWSAALRHRDRLSPAQEWHRPVGMHGPVYPSRTGRAQNRLRRIAFFARSSARRIASGLWSMYVMNHPCKMDSLGAAGPTWHSAAVA